MLSGVCATRAVLTDAANEAAAAAATADRFAGLPLKERLRALAKIMGTKKSGVNSLAVKRTAVGSTFDPARVQTQADGGEDTIALLDGVGSMPF